jgi:hypothetical protein
MPFEFVNTLISSGLDSFTNLYDVLITLPTRVYTKLGEIGRTPTGVSEDQAPHFLKVRIGDFQAPQPKLAQYNTDYQTIQITRVAPMMELERKFDITFRIDSEYRAYHILKQWSFLYHDILQGGINLPTGAETDVLGAIRVDAYAPNSGQVTAAWTFGKVICNKVTEPNYSRAGTEAATVTASFMFFEYLDPTGVTEEMRVIPGTIPSDLG